MRYLSLLFLAPYITGYVPPDSSFNEVSIGAGGGQYAVYSCQDSRPHAETFTDVGIRLTHKFEGPLRIGVSGTYVKAMNGGIVPYPEVALDFRYFSFGTTGLRLGAEDEFYGEFSLLDQVPAFSGKGFARIGLGWNVPDWNTRFWIGQNSTPYRMTSWAGQVDFPVSSNTFLFVNGRSGTSNGISEYGLSLGVRIRNQ